MINFHVSIIRRWPQITGWINSSGELGRKCQVLSNSTHASGGACWQSSSWHGGLIAIQSWWSIVSLIPFPFPWMSCWQVKPAAQTLSSYLSFRALPAASFSCWWWQLHQHTTSHRLTAVLSLLTLLLLWGFVLICAALLNEPYLLCSCHRHKPQHPPLALLALHCLCTCKLGGSTPTCISLPFPQFSTPWTSAG